MRLLSWLLLVTFLVGLSLIWAPDTQAVAGYSPFDPVQLEQEIEEFMAAGAGGYLVWQYSGDSPKAGGTYFENDKYSFFRNGDQVDQEICATLQKMGQKHNGTPVGIGVNIWSLGKYAGVAADHLSYLKSNCGVKTIRLFAKEQGSAGVSAVLSAADAVGVQVIVAIGDYSNGGGGVPQGAGADWYRSGYLSPVGGIVYNNFASEIAQAAAGHSSLFGLELANEPHCGGDAVALPYYRSWAATISGLLRGKGIANIGYGQMASHPGSACDGPSFQHAGGSGFQLSNSETGINMTSAHYYDPEQKALALLALEQSLGLGKLFYIGEAGAGSADRGDYYLQPLNSLVKQGQVTTPEQAGQVAAEIYSELVDEGYQVQCTAPTQHIFAKLGGLFGALTGQIDMGVGSTFTFDYSESEVPMLRNADPNQASLEDFWSKRIEGEDPLQEDIASAPIYSLLSLEEQCRQKVQLLQTIEAMCNKLDVPTSCALYQPIRDSNYTTQSLLGEIRALNISCQDLYQSSGNQNLSTADQSQLQSVKQALANLPLNLTKSYRMAFLVLVANLRDDGPGTFFRFLSREDVLPDEVRVVAFKIPDIGLNRSYQSGLYFDDSLQLTRNSFLQVDEIERIKTTEQERRNGMLGKFGQGQVITCANCDQSATIRALVSLVNATGQSCDIEPEALKAEPVTSIFNSGTINTDQPPDPSTILADDGQGNSWPLTNQLEANLNPQVDEPPQQSLQTKIFNFASRVMMSAEPQGNAEAKLKAYLIIPQGTELESVEKTLAGYLYTVDELEKFNSDPDNKKYYSLGSIIQELESDRPQVKVNTAACVNGQITQPDGSTQECTAEAYLEADTTDREPRILGGILGQLTRNIQQSLHEIGSQAHDYISSCQTTEDFLLGRCSGQPPRSTPQSPTTSDLPLACRLEYELDTIQLPTSLEALAQVVDQQVTEFNQANGSDLPPTLVWGLLQIEGSPVLRAIRSGQSALKCTDTINSCGAVGPLQIIQGICVTDACSSSAVESLKEFNRAGDLCSIEGALNWAMTKLLSDADPAAGDQMWYRAAGRYHGLADSYLNQFRCNGAPAVAGCNGLNYCQCAMDGFDCDFYEKVGEPAPMGLGC